jgi:hypothetical protein
MCSKSQVAVVEGNLFKHKTRNLKKVTQLINRMVLGELNYRKLSRGMFAIVDLFRNVNFEPLQQSY